MRILFILVFSFLITDVLAQNNFFKNEFGFKSENDAFLATAQDRYYTNGLFFSFRSALKPNIKQDTSKLVKKIWSVHAGQKMYNAQSGYVPDITYVDRPFAAYIFGSTSLQWLFRNENIFKAEIQGGITGPSALGKEGQEFYHDVFGFYDLNGWQFQVKDELALNINLNYDRLIYRSKNKTLDFSLPLEARIGNTFSGVKAGILFRTGSLNPLYHSIATQSNVASYQEPQVNEKELYFFLKPSLDFVIYDATVSGGLFRDDKGAITYDTKPLVFSQELGIAYAKNRWTLDFSILFKSREIKSSAKAHQYGIVDIYYRF